MQATISQIASRLAVQKSSTRGLGIDVGQQDTKVVWFEKTGAKNLQASAIRFSTEIEPVEVSNQEDQLSIAMPSSQAADKKERRSEEMHPFSRRKADTGKTTKWKPADIAALCDRIVNMVGTSYRTAPIHLSLSMSVCDFRGVYLRSGNNGPQGSLQDALAESIGSREPRVLAIMDQDTTQAKRRVFSLPRETALAFGDSFEKSGMPPMSMDGLPWSMARCLQIIKKQQQSANPSIDFDGPQIIFDWSWGRPTLVAVNGKELTYVRRLNNGSLNQLCSQAKADLQLTNHQAARWLSHCNAAKVERELMEDTRHWMELRCAELCNELNEAVEYVAWRLKGGKIKNLWLTGGGAAMGLEKWIRPALPCPVQLWSLETSSGTIGPEYATATALAAKGAYDAI